MNADSGQRDLIVFEDEHLLVINKPAGMNTHAPSPYAGEGIYEWLKNRDPRWAKLAIIHRLDKDTSGLMVFGKSTVANKSLTSQFATRRVRKNYILATDKPVSFQQFTARSKLVRVNEKYASSKDKGDLAETVFRKIQPLSDNSKLTWIEAQPLTGRTHQIRVHAAENGFPILGDPIYGGSPAPRLCLHAAELSFEHPSTRRMFTAKAAPRFFENTRLLLRHQLIDGSATNAYRVIHGAADGHAGLFVDRLGDWLLAQSERPLTRAQESLLNDLMTELRCSGIYHKLLRKDVQKAGTAEASPQLLHGNVAPQQWSVRENGLQYSIRFSEGYSVGIFLDQRDNRGRLMTGYVAPDFTIAGRGEILNSFAYTCAFSVAAAKAGHRTTSLDLSRSYLDWGKDNFQLNQLDPAQHDFIYGDAFDWFRRLTKQNRAFDVVILDPPTFSRSKEGVFQAEKDYGKLVAAALPLVKKSGVLLASTNAAKLKPEDFLKTISHAVVKGGRKILQQHYVPQPTDFPVSRDQPGYLKTVWIRLS
jgi:23S rRNA (cytosine1962-C5)-methyltransferase